MVAIDWKVIGYVKRSKNRFEALKLFEKPTMPSELAQQMKISLTHGSKIARELNSKKLIHCLNEGEKIGRLYIITQDGLKVLKMIK